MTDDSKDTKTTDPSKEDDSVENLKAKNTRLAEQNEGNKQDALKLKTLQDGRRAAVKDGSSILDFAEKHPELKDELAKEFGHDSFEDLKVEAGLSEEKKEKPSISTDDIAKIVKEQFDTQTKTEQSKQISKLEEKFFTKLSEADNADDVKKEYEELTEDRNLNPEQAEKYLKKAFKLVNGDKELQYEVDKHRAKGGTTSFGTGEAGKAKKAEAVKAITPAKYR